MDIALPTFRVEVSLEAGGTDWFQMSPQYWNKTTVSFNNKLSDVTKLRISTLVDKGL